MDIGFPPNPLPAPNSKVSTPGMVPTASARTFETLLALTRPLFSPGCKFSVSTADEVLPPVDEEDPGGPAPVACAVPILLIELIVQIL